MKIDTDMVVEIQYTVTLDSGEVVEGAKEPARYSFIFGKGQIFPALERKLKGLKPGDTMEVTLTPAEGFGERRPELMREVPLSEFPPDLEIEVGHMYRTVDAQGNPMYFSIREKTDKTAILDFNHPLAGENLHFKVSVVSVRPATAEELAEAGSVCIPGGCASCSEPCD
ncbi:MAG TPA: peptidylprolyl isomerase [Candidatus Desulfofervidus auxilii]|uniref:Peptidyl-prolyl cis-trans isomerase n=1 Tax=Desulfofervidus auxilii TaxID=1621989 RepID=A0A7C0U4D0_DESA2|nr:peptidylprolyl isomerase [Candidatus Desulfofervidus auxilii]